MKQNAIRISQQAASLRRLERPDEASLTAREVLASRVGQHCVLVNENLLRFQDGTEVAILAHSF